MTLPPASQYACVRCGVRAQSCEHARILLRVRHDHSGCWIWLGARKRVKAATQAYGNVWMDGRYEVAHRAFYLLLVGPIPEGAVLRHSCDVGLCVNPAHLIAGTSRENTADMVARGRSARGARNGGARLTDHDVRAIRRGLTAGKTQQAVAQEFAVSRSTVGAIATRRRWGWLE